MASHRAPSGLESAGRSLWRGVVDEFELTAAERAILASAARTADVIAALEAEAGPLMDGNGRPAPVLVELRQQRITLARLLVALRLPADENDQQRPQQRPMRGVYPLRVS